MLLRSLGRSMEMKIAFKNEFFLNIMEGSSKMIKKICNIIKLLVLPYSVALVQIQKFTKIVINQMHMLKCL